MCWISLAIVAFVCAAIGLWRREFEWLWIALVVAVMGAVLAWVPVWDRVGLLAGVHG